MLSVAEHVFPVRVGHRYPMDQNNNNSASYEVYHMRTCFRTDVGDYRNVVDSILSSRPKEKLAHTRTTQQ